MIAIGNFYFLIWSPLILYLILNLSFSLADAIINRHFTAFFVLPFVYLTIHLSYGLGFLLYSIRNIFKSNKEI